MRNALLATLLVVALALAPAAAAGQADRTPTDTQGCDFPVTETDATETAVTLEAEPETVVTLNPSAAQTMWEIDAREKVVGVTKHASNLANASSRANITQDGETVNLEAVVELDPDLVLAPSSQFVTEELVAKLRDAGLTVYHFPSATSIDDVRAQTRLTGRLVGACAGAEETVAWMDREIEVVQSAIEGVPRPDVLYAFYGFTAGEETFIHEILEAAGGNNIAAEVGVEEYRQINEETVVEEDPDWLVLNSDSPEVPDGEAYEATTAVREAQVVVVNTNYLNRPGPRIVHGISELAKAFHPDAYAAAMAANGTTSTSTPAPEPTPSEPSQTGTGAEGQPGFGAGVGLLAILGAAFLARRTDGGA